MCTCYGVAARKCGPVTTGKLIPLCSHNTLCNISEMTVWWGMMIVRTLSLLQWIYYEAGFLICAALGIFFVVLTPIIGMCFCVCRCCENCGGEMHQRQRKNVDCQRGFYTASLIATSIFIMWVVVIFSSVFIIIIILLIITVSIIFYFHQINLHIISGTLFLLCASWITGFWWVVGGCFLDTLYCAGYWKKYLIIYVKMYISTEREVCLVKL